MEGRIAKEWASYRERIVPANACELQVVETRRAFYAGAAALFQTVVGGLSEGDDATPEDLALLDSVQRELSDFVDDVGKGRA